MPPRRSSDRPRLAPRQRVATALVGALVVLSAACSGDDGADDGGASTASTDADASASTVPPTSASPTSATPTVPPTGPPTSAAPAPFDTTPGTTQVTVTGATPSTELSLVDAAGAVVASGTVDASGALLFRDVAPGTEYVVRGETADGTVESEPVTPLDPDEHPPAAFYAGQQLPAPGYGYLETRDGTTLSVVVRLPGPPEDGPYPTVVEYSGYTPSNPDDPGLSRVFSELGYAYVGVNMRGTGCSGGSFRFFEPSQLTDGYDVIETVAAQPWVLGGRVGMVGVSYPGISQLFVASTRPPGLAAITPFSVIDDSFRSTLYPGGILNTGFAVEWTSQRVAQARPEGQAWAADRIADGDEVCAANQGLRLQNPDLVREIAETPFVVEPLASSLAPSTFVDRIEVPVLIAGAWQDEQTGGRFPVMLDRFTGSPHVYASLVNGLHTDSISPGVLPRLVEFLDLYVAQRTPSLEAARRVAPQLAQALFGTADVTLPPDRFAGRTFEEALAAFEAEPPIQVLFEQGGVDGATPRSPLPRFVASFDAWPIPGTVATSWYLDADGSLVAAPPTTPGETGYLALPDAIPATFYEGSSSALWRTDVTWNWQQPPPGTAASFVSEPLVSETVMVGSGSVDLWLASNLGDTDVEVTLSEVRPDGDEVYVQSGWLRASRRALDPAASTELRPVHTHVEADAAPLPDGRVEPVRVELFPFAHVFRPGSRLRLTVDAPGGNRAVWEFDTIANGEQVTIAHGGATPSRIVLPVVPGVDAPDTAPACGALRGQPCRPYGAG